MIQPPLSAPNIPERWKENNPKKPVYDAKKLVRENLIHILENEKTNDGGSRVSADLVGRLERALDSGSADYQVNGDKEQDKQDRLFLSFHRSVPSVVQNGPSCGLAALCMAFKMLLGETPGLEAILEKAKDLNFTKQGEMFSARNLCSLASHLVPCHSVVLDDDSNGGNNGILLRDAILDGGAILVPYDRDFNNEPCLKSGQKAHWALITGLVFVTNRNVIEHISDKSTICRDDNMPNLFHATLDKSIKSYIDFLADVALDFIYVYAVQGKSIRTHLWHLSDLLKSNGQLRKLDPELEKCIEDFVVPSDGVASGLCNKIVLLSKI